MQLVLLLRFIPPEKNGEGDWIDPKERLAPNCLGHCSGWMNEYMACVARISARVDGKGDCNGQSASFEVGMVRYIKQQKSFSWTEEHSS